MSEYANMLGPVSAKNYPTYQKRLSYRYKVSKTAASIITHPWCNEAASQFKSCPMLLELYVGLLAIPAILRPGRV